MSVSHPGLFFLDFKRDNLNSEYYASIISMHSFI